MTTKRRSLREKKVAKYSVESSDDEEENDDPKLKKAKMKLKEMMMADSDAESDFEKEMEKDTKIVSEESDADSMDEKENQVPKKTALTRPKPGGAGGVAGAGAGGGGGGAGGGLDLSESDSSDGESPRVAQVAAQLPRALGKVSYFGDDGEEEEGEEASRRLLALAGNLESMKNTWQEKSEGKDPKDPKARKVTKKARKPFRARIESECLPEEENPKMDISSLLVQGEAAVEGEEMEEEEAVEEEEREPVVSKEGVEVTVALPENMRRKKKKGFDMAAYMRRRLGRVRREVQVLLHRVHFLGLVAHLRHLDSLLERPVLQAVALSLVPPAHLATPAAFTLTRLAALATWFRGAMPVTQPPAASSRTSLALLRAMATMLALDITELVMVFVLVCRSLGLHTRVVTNLTILPLKLKETQNKVGTESKEDHKETEENEESKYKDKVIKKQDKESKTSKGKKKANTSKSDEKPPVNKTGKDSKKTSKPARSPPSGRGKRKSEEGGESAAKVVRTSPALEREGLRRSGRRAGRVEEQMKREAKEEEEDRDDADFVPAPTKVREGLRKSGRGAGKVKEEIRKNVKEEEKEDKDDEDFVPSPERSPVTKGKSLTPPKGEKARRKSGVAVEARDAWAEVHLPALGRWVAVDLLNGLVDRPADLEVRCSRPLVHVLAVAGGAITDVTQRYAANFLTETRKLRTEAAWLEAALGPFAGEPGEAGRREQEELARKAAEAPLPSTIGQFKDHPLYALTRHLLKFEAIYPANAPTLGFIRGEPVFARECVRTLNGRTAWLKEGRVVRLGETPYKVVKARPKWDRMTGAMKTDEPLEVFGEWQTELFVAPPAADGKVPRNEYGNVELFKPWMLPAGTVHIPINGMKAMLRREGIDAAPAMVGWDFSSGGSHPVFDGVVVCEEEKERVEEAWAKEVARQERREQEKRESRVSGGLGAGESNPGVTGAGQLEEAGEGARHQTEDQVQVHEGLRDGRLGSVLRVGG